MKISKTSERIYSRPRFIICASKENKTNNTKERYVKNKFINIVAIFIIAMFTAIHIIKSLNPVINELCINEAKNIATKVANYEATKVMDKYNYEDFITITKDNNDNVIMLQANTNTINSIASDIPVRILDEFSKNDNTLISIRLGSALGLKIFSGSGPKINARIANVGNVETNLKSEFTSQGINQTLHRIYLEISANVSILTPYDVINENIINQVLIAESVIIGNVPESYYNLNGIRTNDNTVITPIE